MCGVDYLFKNHSQVLWELSNVVGSFYIQRNVFLCMEAFYGSKVRTLEELFFANDWITTWFTEKQFEFAIKRNFVIEKEFNLIQKSEYGNIKTVGYLCATRDERIKRKPENHYEENINILRNQYGLKI